MKTWFKTAAILFVCYSNSYAVPVLVTNLAGQDQNDSVNWVQFGSPITNVPSGSIASSAQGNSITATTGSSFSIRTPGTGWISGFNPGDIILYNGGGGPVTLAFANAVRGVGFFFENDAFGNFTANLEAFDSSNTSLGIFSVPGNSGDAAQTYLGVLDTSNSISRVVITADNGPDSFAIGSLAISASVPEMDGATAAMPMTLILGMLVLLAERRKRATLSLC